MPKKDGRAPKKAFEHYFPLLKYMNVKSPLLSENGRATDERLNALINAVERQISKGRNGKL